MKIRNAVPDELRDEVSGKGTRRLRRYKAAVRQLTFRRLSRERIFEFLVQNGCSPDLSRWLIAEALNLDLEQWDDSESDALESARKELEERPVTEHLAKLCLAGGSAFFTYVLAALLWEQSQDQPGGWFLFGFLSLVLLSAGLYLLWGFRDLWDRYTDWRQRRSQEQA